MTCSPGTSGGLLIGSTAAPSSRLSNPGGAWPSPCVLSDLATRRAPPPPKRRKEPNFPMSNPFDHDRDSNALPGAAFADEATADDHHDAFTQRATAATQRPTDYTHTTTTTTTKA